MSLCSYHSSDVKCPEICLWSSCLCGEQLHGLFVISHVRQGYSWKKRCLNDLTVVKTWLWILKQSCLSPAYYNVESGQFFFFECWMHRERCRWIFQNTHRFCVLFYSAVRRLHILSRAVSKGNCLNFHMERDRRSASTKSFICVLQILRAVWNRMEESGSAVTCKKNCCRLLCNVWTFSPFFMQIHCSDQSSHRKEHKKPVL